MTDAQGRASPSLLDLRRHQQPGPQPRGPLLSPRQLLRVVVGRKLSHGYAVATGQIGAVATTVCVTGGSHYGKEQHTEHQIFR